MTDSHKPEQERVASLEERLRRFGEPERAETRSAWEGHDAPFRTIFDSAPVGIAKLDGLGRLIDGNSRLHQLFGYSLEECRGRPLTDFTHPSEIEPERKGLKDLREGRRAQYWVQRPYRRKDGSLIWVSMRVAYARTEPRQPECFIATLEDVSERRDRAPRGRHSALSGQDRGSGPGRYQSQRLLPLRDHTTADRE